eukprot:g26232.t1
MMVLAYRIQADVLRSAEEDKSKDIKAALSTAEGLAREHTAKFNASGDKRSEAVLLLAAGEINYNKRGGKKRAEAFEDLKKARALAKEAEVDFDGSGWTSNAFDCLTQAFICKGDAKKAMIISEEAVEYFQRKKDKRGQVMALSTLANSYCAKGDYEAAVPLIEETREIIQSLDDTRWEASILHQLASVHMLRESSLQDLKDRHSEALAMNYITQTGDKSKEASCLLTVATVHGTEGRLDDALRVAKEAQELFQEKKDRSGEARALNVLADIYCDLREVEQAVALAKEMRAKLQETGDMRAEVGAIRTLSNIYLASEMPGESVRAANEAVQLSKRVHDRRQLAENLILSSEANIALAMQDSLTWASRSRHPAKEAYKVAKTIGAGKLMGMAMHQTAYVLLVTVKPDEALKAAREAVDIFRQVDERAREAGSVILIAEIYHSKSEDEKALDAANEGLMLAKACGDPKKEKDANKLIEQIAGKKYAYYQPYPGGSAQAAASAVAVEKQVGLDPNMVQATVSEMAKQAIGVDDELFLDSALMDSGMDSLTAVSFRNGLQQQLGVKLPSSLMFDYPTMKEVANRIVELSIENA